MITFAQFLGQIDKHFFPADQLLHFAQMYSFIFPKVVIKDPMKSAMLFLLTVPPMEELPML